MADHRWTVDRGSARAADAERSIAGLDLGRWDQVRRHLLARLVPRQRSGPLAFEPPLALGARSASVRFDVGIDVPGGIVRLDRDLIRCLSVSPAEIWRAAVTNLAAREHPSMLRVSGGSGSFVVLAGGPWATGLLLVPDQLDLATAPVPSPDSCPNSVRRSPGSDPAVVVAPHPEVLVVGRTETVTRSGVQGGPGQDSVARATLTLAATLAEADGGPRLPLVPLLPVRSLQEVLSRAGGFWNDVPVSEQPGLR